MVRENFWYNHLHPDDREKSVRFRQEATARCENHELEYRMLAADGRVVWLRDVVRVVETAETPTTLKGFMFDISDLKQIEETLRLKERALAATNNGIIIADARLPYNPVIYVNCAFEQITGYSATDVIGQNCRFCNAQIYSNQDSMNCAHLFKLEQVVKLFSVNIAKMVSYSGMNWVFLLLMTKMGS